MSKVKKSRKGSKAHNMNKRSARAAIAELRHKAVAWSSDFGAKQVIITNAATGKMATISSVDFFGIESMQHKWNIVLMVFCTDQNGENYMISHESDAPVYCKHHQLIDSLNKEHKELADTVNKNHIVATAWVATVPYITTDQAMLQVGKDPKDWVLIREKDIT